MTHDPVSPELALVSPELRAEALASLPAAGTAVEPRVRAPDPPLRLTGPKAHAAPPIEPQRRRPFATVEVTVRVPVIAVAAAYFVYGLAMRVTGGVALAMVLVLTHSLLAG